MKNNDYTLYSFVTGRKETDSHSFYLKVDPERVDPVKAADTALRELLRYRSISGIYDVQMPLIQSLPVCSAVPLDPAEGTDLIVAEDTTLLVFAKTAARVDVEIICRAAIRAALRDTNLALWRPKRAAPSYGLRYFKPADDYAESCVTAGTNVRHTWLFEAHPYHLYGEVLQRHLKQVTDGGVYLYSSPVKEVHDAITIEVFAQPDADIRSKAEAAIQAAVAEVANANA